MKFTAEVGQVAADIVAPFAGAWIEIRSAAASSPGDRVAPFAGAWIEMRMVQSGVERVERRSLRGSVD